MEVINQVYPTTPEQLEKMMEPGPDGPIVIGQPAQVQGNGALAEYPNRAALVAMSSSEAFRKIAVHRSAGLEGQLNIETVYQPQMPQQLG